MSEELKPCPFCGYSHPDGHSHVELNALGRVECFCCSASIYGKDEAAAITAWNARAESPLADSHARLVEALGLLLADADYGNGACRINEPIAAVLPPETLVIARAAIADAKKVQEAKHGNTSL